MKVFFAKNIITIPKSAALTKHHNYDLIRETFSSGYQHGILLVDRGFIDHNWTIMGKNAVNIGQNYFHNEDLSEAKILIMKIIWTDIHGHYSHNVVKIFLVCTRFYNEKGDITTTQED